MFENAPPGAAPGPTAAEAWARAACAPMVQAGPKLLAARRRLLARARALGHAMTGEADPVLVLHGAVLRPLPWPDGLCFALPDGGGPARLASRSHVSAEVDAASPDERRLGLSVTSIRLDGVDLPLT